MTVADALVAVAAFDLPGSTISKVQLATTSEAEALVLEAGRQRIQGLLVAAIDGDAVSGPGLAGLADHEHRRMLRASLMAEEGAVLAFDALSARDIEGRLLKGVANAHLDYPDPAWRVFADADILIRRDDHGAAIAALTAAGFTRLRPAVRTWWERRYGKAVVLRSPTGSELDLHLALAGGYFGVRLNHEPVWAREGHLVDLAGRGIRALAAEDRFLHACFHSMLGDHSGLRARRDAAQLILVSGADWRTTVTSAIENGVDGVIAEALTETWRLLRLANHPAADWAATHRTDEQQLRSLQAYQETFATEWGSEGLSAIPALGHLDTVGYLAGLAVPSPASLASRERGLGEHLRHGFHVLRSRP